MQMMLNLPVIKVFQLNWMVSEHGYNRGECGDSRGDDGGD